MIGSVSPFAKLAGRDGKALRQRIADRYTTINGNLLSFQQRYK